MARLFFVLLLLSSPAFGKTLLVFGDSLSANYGFAAESSWVKQLQNRLSDAKLNYRVINASISGETTQGGRYRLPQVLGKAKPDIVILELGANDGLRGLPLEQVRSNLEAMIQQIKSSRAQVLLVGMRLPPNYGPVYTEKFHSLYRDLAHKYRLVYAPFMLEKLHHPVDFQADGLHPTAQSQRAIFEYIWSYLQPMLRERAASLKPDGILPGADFLRNSV